MNKNICNTKAFSLVELMVVIAIVGLLSSVAVSSYKNYNIKVRVSQELAKAHTLQNNVAHQYSLTGNLVTAGGSYVLAGSNSYIEWNSGYPAIAIHFAGPLLSDLGGGTKQVLLTPTVSSAGVITWTCGAQFNYPVACIYLPPNCQGNYCY